MFDWQTILVVLIVAVAVAFVSRRVWRKMRGFSNSSCATGCGKCGDESVSSLPKLQQIKRC